MPNTLVPRSNQNTVLQRFINGELEPQDFINAIDYLSEHGERIIGQAAEYYDRVHDTVTDYNRGRRESAMMRQLISELEANTPSETASSQASTISPQNNADTNPRPNTRRRLDIEGTSQPGMEAIEHGPTVANADRLNASATGQPARSTPVDIVPNTRPWHNTTQAIIHETAYFSVNDLSQAVNTFTEVFIRCNSYKDMWTGSVANVVNQVAGDIPVSGISFNAMAGNYLTVPPTGDYNYQDHLVTFPVTNTNAMQPYMKQYYERLYAAYTVLKLDWAIDVSYPPYTARPTSGADAAARLTNKVMVPGLFDGTHSSPLQLNWMVPKERPIKVFAHYNQNSTSMTEDTNIPVGAPLDDLERWPGIIKAITLNPGETKTISGTWYPGLVHHNCLNDSDIEIWTTTGTSPAKWTEDLVLSFKKDWNAHSTATQRVGVNARMRLNYTVQYKDLKQTVLWPTRSGAEVIDMGMPAVQQDVL